MISAQPIPDIRIHTKRHGRTTIQTIDACEDNTCAETSQKAEHSIENDVCSVCGYEQSNPTPPPTPSANEVTEEQFNAAVSFVGITSVTVHSESNTNIVNGVQQEVCYATMYLQDNKLKYVSGNLTAYNEVYNTFAYGYSYDTEQEKWLRIKIEDTDDDFSDLMTFATIKEMFEGIDFSDLVYADGSYTGSQIFEEGTDDEYTVNFRFQFEDGRLISACGEYEVEGFACYDNLTFSDYNTTTVSLPAAYEDYTEPTPNPDDSWASYFEFDNVTVSLSSSTYYPDYDMTITSSESMKVQGEEWLWETTDYFYNDNLYDEFAVYFDGTNAYVYGVIDNELNTQNVVFFLNADFSAYEHSFTETSSGVFEADEISAYGVYTYKDVQLVISNGKIISISYSIEFSSGGTSYTQTVEYTFSDWDETGIDGDKYTQPSTWGSYFDFENVTITEILQYVVEGTTHSMDTSWEVDNGSWVCNKVMEKVDGIATVVNQAYYDGINYYLNGTLVSEADVYAYYYLSSNLLGDLIGCENLFNSTTQGSKIIYFAESITLYDVIVYTDVELTVDNGKIVKLTYKKDNAALHDGAYYTGTYTITFSNYGTTVVEGSTEPSHTCSYDEKVVSSEYLRTSATCENLATYYYSCECEKAGTEWFEYGVLAECAYGDWRSNNDDTHSRICSNNSFHIDTKGCYGGSATCINLSVCDYCEAEYGSYTQHYYTYQIITDEYLKSPATCEAKATYHWACEICGDKGDETFEYGEALGCDYGAWKSNGNGTHSRICSRDTSHVETADCSGGTATCTAKARCAGCGSEYGKILPHSFVKEVVDKKYLKTEATCTTKAVYYKSCDCGLYDEETFEYGDALDHDWCEGVCVRCNKEYGLEFTLSTDGTFYSVTGIGTCEYVDIIIPSKYKQLPVKEIGDQAFVGNEKIESIELSDEIISIGQYAFRDCVNLYFIDLNDGLETVKYGAFYNCNLQTVTLGSAIQEIEDWAFAHNTEMTKVYYLGTLDDWCEIIFGGEYANPISITKSLYIDDTKVTDVVTTDSLLTIGAYAFYDYPLNKVAIGNSVSSIGEYSFFNSTVNDLTVGTAVKTIGERAFETDGYTRTKLTVQFNAIEMQDLKGTEHIFWNTTITVLTIGANVKKIPAYLFYNNVSENSPSYYYRCQVSSLIFEENSVCTTIGNCAFTGSGTFGTITLPASLKKIGYYAFSDCGNLYKVTFEDTSTWYVTDNATYWQNSTNGTQITVTSTGTNATNLEDTYSTYYWYKK